ncbi:MAG: sigma-54-dependent transcriptional regulator [Gammaproteobacteria bacterium]
MAKKSVAHLDHANRTNQAKNGKPALLLVDDVPLIAESLALALEEDYQVTIAESRPQAKLLLQKMAAAPSLALVDLGLPPTQHLPDEGFALIDELLAFNYHIKILVLSGQSDKANIQHALTLGAVDFVPKPCDVKLLQVRLDHQMMMLDAESTEDEQSQSDSSLLGESPAITTLHQLIEQFSDTPFPVLIEGESGSGKELVAQYTHANSTRSEAPFLTINCAAFTAELLEAQLFGYTKGAFTGAIANRAGFFEDAGEGSLFLDEIGELPLNLQSKLLRVLENGEYYRLGETSTQVSKARIIAATNKDLKEAVRAGEFRQDLYHRISVLTVHVPPLREREKDYLLLLNHFRTLYSAGTDLFSLTADAEGLLGEYSFPGNVRELRNIVIRLVAKYPGKKVDVEQLQDELEEIIFYLADEDDNDVHTRIRQELSGNSFQLDVVLGEREKRYILMAMGLCGGNLSKAARMLGVNRTTLYSRMQRLGIDEETA